MVRFILDVNDQWGTTIILIEHDMGVVMDISHSGRDGSRGEDRRRAAGRSQGRPGRHPRLPGRRTERGRPMNWQFFLEVLVGGLLAGVMYSLVALGFVLIYKASGVFNFAQGAMVFFAALTFVSLLEKGVISGSRSGHAGGDGRARDRDRTAGVATSRQSAADHAVHGDHRPVVRARRAVAALLGFAAARPRARHPGRADAVALRNDGHQRQPVRPVRGGRRRILVAALAIFFQTTRIGRALRAVADDHQAALAVGIPLRQIWAIVWTVAGFVALVAGVMWGARNGVQYALTFIALKALPVLILGGFESVAGAIVGGLIIGASEKLAEVYLGPFVGGGLDSWFPYVLALAFLLIRPEGLFGEKRIERVRSACSIAKQASSRPPTRPTSRSFRSGRTASASRSCSSSPSWWFRSRRPILALRHPHAVPDLCARHARLEHPDRLRRPAFAGHGGVHGGRRVHGVQFRVAGARFADSGVVHAGRTLRGGRGRRLRPAVACASRASTSPSPRSPASSSCCGRCSASAGSPITAPPA